MQQKPGRDASKTVGAVVSSMECRRDFDCRCVVKAVGKNDFSSSEVCGLNASGTKCPPYSY